MSEGDGSWFDVGTTSLQKHESISEEFDSKHMWLRLFPMHRIAAADALSGLVVMESSKSMCL